jgi:flap endonuclease-1
MSMLIGTDFNEGVKGIGPKTALKLIREHGSLEEMPPEVYSKLDADVDGIREIFLKPDVTDDYEIIHGALQEDELYSFLCGERAFSRDRVEVVVKRMKAAQMQRSLSDWIGGTP